MTVAAIKTSPLREHEYLSRLLKAAGDPLRLQILAVLRRDSFGVLELCRIFGVAQPAMSHHLKVLSATGLLWRRREGTSIFYSRARCAEDEQLQRAIFCAADRLTLDADVAAGVASVHADRGDASRQFFETRTGEFGEQQELLAPRAQYQSELEQLCADAAARGNHLALEIGPGDGWLLPALSRLFARVIAVDNSTQMLDMSRETCKRHRLGNVELVADDSAYCRSKAVGADLAILNMVLHHTASPAGVLADVALSLKPGGMLIVCDLCAHDQSWVQQECGDLWLGFAPEDISCWTDGSCLEEESASYFALRNGFSVQMRAFRKAH